MNPVVQQIATLVSEAYDLTPDEISELIVHPPDESLGDYALPCFVLAKALKKAPPQIAEEVAQLLSGDLIAKAEPAGPYVNITADRNVLMGHILGQVRSQGDTYGGHADRDESILIDFSSPNIAKPFSIAHLRSTGIGNSLKKIYQHLGYNVVGVNHLGDWGVQFGTLISAYKRWGDDEKIKSDNIFELLRIYVKFNEEAENDPSLKDEARAWFKKLEERDDEAFELWDRFVNISLTAFERYYEMLGVEFELIAGESAYRDQTGPLIEELLEKGIAEESEGALIIRIDKENKEIPPLLLKTQDGTTIYATRDLCAAISQWNNYKFTKKLYVVDARQSLHFKQVFDTLARLGHEWAERLVHVPFGVMFFEDQKMSTRKGEILFLEDVLDQAIAETRSIIESVAKGAELSEQEIEEISRQVGISAVIYADLSRSRIHDINFRMSEVLNFNGKSGPYIQYTHARMAGVLRKYEKELPSEINFGLLNEPSETALAKHIEIFPGKVQQAAEENEPFIIAEYLGNLAVAVNKFYDHCRVIGEPADLEAARITLVDCARVVLRKGLELLGMSTPERM